MSKGVKGKALKAAAEKIIHGPFYQYIPAGMASPAPPVGSMLGTRNINISQFVKEFNEKTENIKPGIPLPTTASLNPDGSYVMEIRLPPFQYYLKQAAGINKGACLRNEIAGKITHRHVYEIAKVKSKDPMLECIDLKEICKMITEIAYKMGIEIVRNIDPDEYAQFLKDRAAYLVEKRKRLDEEKEAAILKTATTV